MSDKRLLDNLNKIVKGTTEEHFNQLIFKKYILLKGSVNLVRYLNDNGYRVTTSSHIGSRKYITLDIAAFVADRDNSEGIDDILYKVVDYLIHYCGRAKWSQRVIYALRKFEK